MRLVLSELDLCWQSRLLDLAKGEQFDPNYLALNDNAVVPTLVDGKAIITESNDIMHYLVRRYCGDGAKLTGRHDGRWLEESLTLHDAVNTFTQLVVNRAKLLALPSAELERRLTRIPDPKRAEKLKQILDHGIDAACVGKARDYVRRLAGEIDIETGRRQWLGGGQYTLADMAILPHINRLDLLGLAPFWKGGSNLIEWLVAARNRPSFDNAIGSFISPKTRDRFGDAAAKAKAEIAGILVG